MALLLSGLGAVQLSLLAGQLPRETFYSGDCGVKLLQVQSLVEQRWRTLSLIYPGERIDPDHRFVETGALVVRKGRVFGSHSAAFAIVSSFPYAWFGYPGLYVVPALSLLAAAFLVWLLAKRCYGPWRALLAMGLLAGATPLLFYGLEFWEHTLAVLLVAGALAAIVVPGREVSGWRLAAAGALLAIAFAVRPEAAAFFVAVLAGLAVTVRPLHRLGRAYAFVIGGYLAVLIPLCLLNEWVFGDPWGTLLGLHLRTGHPDPKLVVLTKLLTPLTVMLAVKLGLAVGAAAALWGLRRREEGGARGPANIVLALIASGAILALAVIEGLRAAELWRKPGELTSLAETLPLLWVLPLVIAGARRGNGAPEREARRLFLTIAIVYVLVVLAVSPTWGGAQWGPRQLLLLMPLLALLGAGFGRVRETSGWVALGAVLLLGAVSLGLQADGIRFLAQVKTRYVQTVKNFDKILEPGAVVASDQFFFQEVLASRYYTRTFFYVGSPSLTGDFVAALRRAGVDHFYFFFRRGSQPLQQDLPAQLQAVGLELPGLVGQRVYVLNDVPYYLIRLQVLPTPTPSP